MPRNWDGARARAAGVSSCCGRRKGRKKRARARGALSNSDITLFQDNYAQALRHSRWGFSCLRAYPVEADPRPAIQCIHAGIAVVFARPTVLIYPRLRSVPPCTKYRVLSTQSKWYPRLCMRIGTSENTRSQMLYAI